MLNNSPLISVITPVYNGGYAFVHCLCALKKTQNQNWELIVVDDGSTDKSAEVAQQFGAKVISTQGRQGPGAARNLGSQIAQGEYLCFIDADCEVVDDVITKLADLLIAKPEIDALFGSYDDAPHAVNFVAQYKNLMHHYVHQQGNEDANTFWAGFGVVRRRVFLDVGGFDLEKYPRPSIEDIDLGYRIKQAGHKIYLAKNLQVKHHKAWRLWGLLKTDILDRGVPWTKILLSDSSKITADLNLDVGSRLSVIAVAGLSICLLAIVISWLAIFPGLIFAGLLLYLNWHVYLFLSQKRGFLFALKSIPLHWLYYFSGGLAFVLGYLAHFQENLARS